MTYILLYLGAIVAANLSVATFGPSAIIVNAFLFIGLDLTCRDKLHDLWKNDHLITKMGALILAGSLLSWLVDRDAGRIALASAIAFGLAAVTDALLYSTMHRWSWLKRSNGSNVGSALVDSIAFPTIAFGSFMPAIIAGQFVAKITGGFVWSLILNR